MRARWLVVASLVSAMLVAMLAPAGAGTTRRTLYLRNVPDEVVDRLRRLAADEGVSVNVLAVRELAAASRRADNPALLRALPDLGTDAAGIVADLEAERDAR